MARVDILEPVQMNRNVVREPVQATYATFKDEDGQVYLQIDAYGSPERAIPGEQGQSLQFGPEGLAALRRIPEEI